jgi:hypothetical protein
VPAGDVSTMKPASNPERFTLLFIYLLSVTEALGDGSQPQLESVSAPIQRQRGRSFPGTSRSTRLADSAATISGRSEVPLNKRIPSSLKASAAVVPVRSSSNRSHILSTS